jgi:nucleotide-binding universal stress UspA family protein
MKNILLLAHDDLGQEARLQAALDIVRRFDGHLSCVDVPIVPEVDANLYGGLGRIMVVQDVAENEVINRRTLEARLANEQVRWTWQDGSENLSRSLCAAASFADLVVLNRDLDSLLVPGVNAAIEAVIGRTRSPVLAVTADATGFDTDGRALIAWDGSAAAVAAVRAAVPLLRLAREVAIYVVDDDSVEIPPEDAATYLSRHGVHARINRAFALDDSAPDMILTEVRNRLPDYVVMGGFGHSRFSEWLIGGVTRKMLQESPVPVLLAQ